MTLIKVILGSTRPERFGIQPAEWIMKLAKEHPEATFELVDLKEVNLPMLDEPIPAIHGQYKHAHTKAWAKTIGEADGFVFVTAEHNYGVPASLKNALDYLAAEWRYKPVAFVSYGAYGGGIRAVQQLREISGNLGFIPLQDNVPIRNYWEQKDADGNFQPTAEQIETAHKLLKNISFWSTKLRPIRQELQQAKA
jgi:NAD(P)H-dependent FMN reductase